MDGVSWGTTRAQESFSRPKTTADTLSRLANFIARADTKQHIRNQKQPAFPFCCQECGKDFHFADELLHHQELKHTLPKPHRCPSCGKEFSLRSSLQLHKCGNDSSPCEFCHGETRIGSPCSVCVIRTSDRDRTQDKSPHRQPHVLDRSPYACAPCGKGFNQKQALLHHQQAGCSKQLHSPGMANASSLPVDSLPVSERESSLSDSSDAPGPSSKTINLCQFCSRNFRTEAALQHHKQTTHADERLIAPSSQHTKAESMAGEGKKEASKKYKSKKKLLSCRSCDLVFKSTAKLYIHRKEKHSRETNPRREIRPPVTKRRRIFTYTCQICSKVFFHHLSLLAHVRRHTASGVTVTENKSQSAEGATKDSRLLENRPNTGKTTADKKIHGAGPGRPRKVPRVKVCKPEKCEEVPKEEEEEEGKEREEEGEEQEEEEEEEREEEEREFPCPSCVEVFSLQSQLREHVELHQSAVKRRQCSVCMNEMDTCKWPGSKRHRLYHCVPCQQGYSSLDSFLEHCQDHLRVKVEEDCITEGVTQQASKA